MSFINPVSHEINCKIVYAGTGLSGKTTNIQYIYEHTQPAHRGKLSTMSTENERTLFFDFLPLSVGEIRGYKTRFHLYSIPGQTFYSLSREFILKGVDGIVFVVDSSASRMEANLESFDALLTSLDHQGYDLNKLPFIVQYNKRDAIDAVALDELETTFNLQKRPFFESIAMNGKGVMETLQAVSQWVIQEMKGGKTT